jgi:hypothetical protein
VPLPAARPAPPSQCQPFDRRPTSRQRLRALVAHFRMIISISKPAPAFFEFRGLCPRVRFVQGHSLPRPVKNRACAVPHRCAVTPWDSL